jgi:hypothetical protein
MGVVGLESSIVDSHSVITGIIHRAVVKDLILDHLIIRSRLKIRIRQRCTYASQYLKGELYRPQLRFDAFETNFGLGFMV